MQPINNYNNGQYIDYTNPDVDPNIDSGNMNNNVVKVTVKK